MLEYIHGVLSSKTPVMAVIECAGVGYCISISFSTYEKLPAIGEEMKILTHLVHRDDAMELYGFATSFERGLFRKLISVTRIGPKLAIAILSGVSPKKLASAIDIGDIKTLSKIPRVGKKTAERIVMELRGKIEISTEPIVGADDVVSQAIEALVTLGFSLTDATGAIRKVHSAKPDASIDELIKFALKK
ncbi:Holliday junction branch migration protein RuvA [bacterium]|nr:Holliday junction branch migration protein RuvA [bacterium]